MVEPAKRLATYADLLALPDHVTGQLIDGELVVQPRPAVRHARASTRLGTEIGPPFELGRGGPGGWVILFEPELHHGDDVLAPDLAGWRLEHVPEGMLEAAYVTKAPDWVCEVLSPSTTRIDRGRKRAIYARERVAHLWLVDPDAKLLEVMVLDGETYRVVLTAEGDDKVHAPPFAAIELDLGLLWRL